MAIDFQIYAVQTLGVLKAKEAQPILEELLEKDIKNLTFYVKMALSKIDREKYLPVLLEDYKKGPNFTKQELAKHFNSIKATEAIPLLTETMKTSTDRYLSRYTGKALAELKAKEAVPVFIELIKKKK